MGLEGRLEELGASRLWIAYHDYAGVARAKAVGRDRLTDAIAGGIGWAKANWDLAITDHQVPDPGFAADSGDLRLVPDPATIRPLPHRPGVALAYGWLTEPDGTPWVGDPRSRLAGAATALADRGVEVRIGMETEFAMYRPTEEGWEPDDHDLMFAQAALDARWELLSAILDGLEQMGIAVHQVAKEYGPAQYEISLLPDAPLAAVDGYLMARDLVKALARQRGVVATFMPKPRAELPGNGLHVHLGLADADGRALLPDADRDGELSATGLAAVAGLLAHARGQAGVGSPTPNSFKRLLPGSWAPAHVAWGFGNRAALIRVPDAGAGRHLEYRSGDASANAYLLVAGLLAAVADGIERNLVPDPAVDRDIGHAPSASAGGGPEHAGLERLPDRLDAALDALEADAVLNAALGPVISRHYLAVKRFEWDSYLAESGLAATDTAVSDWERATYLEAV
jgi:glutamine synthetase